MEESLIIGFVSGLIGIFYRNLLKGENMLLNPLYKVFKDWVDQGDFCREFPTEAKEEGMNLHMRKFLRWIAHPLGYCIYCNTTWIAIIIFLVMANFEDISFIKFIILLITSISVSHIVVVIYGKWILPKHPDLDDE